jgi:hypothetical protein
MGESQTSYDHRKALAGIAMLSGVRTGKALIQAGFSPWTARVPKAKGLDAAVCIAEAAKVDPECRPANLLTKARGRLRELLDDDGRWKRARVGEVARMIESCERYYGAGRGLDALGEGETLEDRSRLVSALTAFVEEKARQLKAGSGESGGDNREAPHKSLETKATSDNVYCVNPDDPTCPDQRETYSKSIEANPTDGHT